ncbi:MAG: hypothetical protein ACN2B6_12645 [Rickettsiales bacterium]
MKEFEFWGRRVYRSTTEQGLFLTEAQDLVVFITNQMRLGNKATVIPIHPDSWGSLVKNCNEFDAIKVGPDGEKTVYRDRHVRSGWGLRFPDGRFYSNFSYDPVELQGATLYKEKPAELPLYKGEPVTVVKVVVTTERVVKEVV